MNDKTNSISNAWSNKWLKDLPDVARSNKFGVDYPPPNSKRKSRKLNTQWPKVGGLNLNLDKTSIFTSPAYLDLFKPGDARLVYAGACPGLSALSRSFLLPAYKASTCSEEGLERRMCELRRDEVGAYYYKEGKYVREPGWNCWYPSHLYPTRRPSTGSPVSVHSRALHVRLPAGCVPERFDEVFDREVRKGALDLWAMTPEALKHSASLGVDPSLLRRFTQYPDWALMPAREIVGFSIFGGTDRLIRIAENAIIKILGLTN